MDIGDKTYKEIEKLLILFYEGSIDGDDQERLYYYFLHLDEVPEEWEADAILIRQLAIRRHCHKQRKQLEAMMQSAPPIRHRRSLRLQPMAYKTAAMLLLFVGITALIYHAWHNALLQPTAPLAIQSTPATATQAQQNHHDDKPATITDNEIKNTADHTTNKYNHTRYAENEPTTPQPDIIATAPIEQEHIPVLLAENETQIEIEQNLVAIDTAIDNINALHTDTILQLQKDLSKYETSYLAYIDIQSYNAGNRIYFCNSDCTNKYMEEAVCEMINGI
ncbi:MAG: hypothetical protein IKY79_04960 [Bacteroidales bacterium]|nr:hypothetical protein [Bacteroidales bacterium]